jgi:hypothetical protein
VTAGTCATSFWRGGAGSAPTRLTTRTSSRRTRPAERRGSRCAESLDPSELLAALKAGHYYSSTGPQIHAISVGDGKVTVRCSAAGKILLTGGTPGKQVVAGDGLTSGVLPLEWLADGAHVRVTVAGSDGGRAWSNPIWLR